MKIAFNPATVAALTTPPNNKDITFDLRGRNIFARGVKFQGTDTWRDIKINNVSIDSNILDLRNGSNTTLTNIDGVVTINSTWRPVVDNLTSDSTTSSLSANQGRVLAGLINGKSDSDHNHDGRYLRLDGSDTMTGIFKAKADQYKDGYNGAINMNNSNIYGLNSIYTSDRSEGQTEGIHFWRDSTHVDTLRMMDGNLLFTPNRPLGRTGTEQIVLHTGNSHIKGSTITINGSSLSIIDQKVTQSFVSSGYTDFRAVLITAETSSSSAGYTPSTVTGQTFITNALQLSPQAGNLYLKGSAAIGTTNFNRKLNVNGDIGLLNSGSIRDLAIGGGIYWNPYAESTTDGSDAASITLVKSGVAGGTTLVLSQMNGANDTIQFQTNGSARLYHNSYPILTTQNTYVSDNKSYINGTEITWVDNASKARKLVNWYSARPTSLNAQFGDGSLRIFHATSSTTEGKCPDDATVLHLAWANNGGWDAQLALAHENNNKMYFRSQRSGTWQPWKTLAFTTDIPSSLKNPHALTISLNGTSQGPYDGSAAKNINITPSSIGAATSDHNHDDRYYTKAESNAKYITDITTSVNKLTFTKNGSNINKDITVNVVYSQGYLTNIPNTDATTKASSGLFIYNSYSQTIGTNSYSSVLSINTGGTIQIAGNWGDSQARNLYWRSQSDRNVADYPWKSWRTILDSENTYVSNNKGYINNTEITQVNNADTVDGYHASGLLTALSNTNNGISITVGGTTKSISNISVNYTSSAGNADTLDGEHAKNFVRTGFYENNNLNSLDNYSFIRSVNSQVSSTSPKGDIGWYNVIQLVHRNGDGDGPNYIGQIALGMTSNVNDIFFRCRRTDPWKTIIHSNNYTEFINNYYWANVKISTTSSTTTSPTVSDLTATRYIKIGNIYLQNADEINNSTSGSIHLNYRNSGNVNLCQGGGSVGIGTTTPSYKLDVNGQMRASGFHHGSVNSDNYMLLAGGGYSQGVPVKYWSIESISIYGPTSISRTNRGGNYTFVTKVEPRIKGSCTLTLQFPSGYNNKNTIIWAMGVLNGDMSNSDYSAIYATMLQVSGPRYYLNLADDASLNNGTCQLYFMCF